MLIKINDMNNNNNNNKSIYNIFILIYFLKQNKINFTHS